MLSISLLAVVMMSSIRVIATTGSGDGTTLGPETTTSLPMSTADNSLSVLIGGVLGGILAVSLPIIIIGIIVVILLLKLLYTRTTPSKR